MELHQLTYFVAVAELRSFSRAAERCGVAQPSLSQQIIKLEQEIGEQLFERVGRSVILSARGYLLLPQAQAILATVQAIKQGSSPGVPKRARLGVGFIPTLAPFVLPQAITYFREQFPDVTLEVVEQESERLVERMRALELDLCFASTHADQRHTTSEPLGVEPLVLAIPEHHALAHETAVTVEMLRSVPFIALTEQHCLSQQVHQFCYERQINPTIVCRTSQLATVRHCVAAGLGVALVPAMLQHAEQHEGCIYRPIADAAPQRPLIVMRHSQRPVAHLQHEFVECVRRCLLAIPTIDIIYHNT